MSEPIANQDETVKRMAEIRTEVDAMATVATALSGVSQACARRVLEWARDRFCFEPMMVEVCADLGAKLKESERRAEQLLADNRRLRRRLSSEPSETPAEES